MTDDATQFYSAWVAVFGQGPQKLLCMWHWSVDQAWRGALKTKVLDEEVAAAAYHNLLGAREDEFEELLQKTVEQLRTTDETNELERLKYLQNI